MQTSNKVFEDISRLMINAMGVAQGARTEAGTAMNRNTGGKWLRCGLEPFRRESRLSLFRELIWQAAENPTEGSVS